MDTKERINKIRKKVIEIVYNAKSGHIGGSLSSADILTILFFEFLKDDDKVIISKGHITPLVYAILNEQNLVSDEDLAEFRKIDGKLEGHINRFTTPKVDFSAGSLGQGLSVANGMAIVKQRENKEGIVYCLLGDGEMQEGQIWEALMTSSKENLSNLTILIDKNKYQLDGSVNDIKNIDPLGHKLASFNIEVLEIDGHNIDEIRYAFNKSIQKREKPLAIICNTLKGKGVSFMENTAGWHGKAPSKEEYEAAINELENNL